MRKGIEEMFLTSEFVTALKVTQGDNARLFSTRKTNVNKRLHGVFAKFKEQLNEGTKMRGSYAALDCSTMQCFACVACPLMSSHHRDPPWGELEV